MLFQNGSISLEEIIESLPHKFRNGKNVNIIFTAYLKQYNKIIKSYIDSAIAFNIDNSTGNQLEKIGNNFLVSRFGMDDDEYRQKIKLQWAIYQASGSVSRINKILHDYFNLDRSIIYIYESGNANIILELNKNNNIKDIVSILNSVINSTKPLGVGFKIEPYSSTIFLDKYNKKTIESIIDRYFQATMNENIMMDNAKHLYDTYFENIAVDRYQKEGNRE